MVTLKERCISEPYGFALANFVDDFRRTHDPKLAENSILDLENLSKVEKAMLAASVDQLFNEAMLERPEWVYDESTFLKKPYFALNAKGGLRIILLRESPRWFRARNLFVSANCLERV